MFFIYFLPSCLSVSLLHCYSSRHRWGWESMHFNMFTSIMLSWICKKAQRKKLEMILQWKKISKNKNIYEKNNKYLMETISWSLCDISMFGQLTKSRSKRKKWMGKLAHTYRVLMEPLNTWHGHATQGPLACLSISWVPVYIPCL